MEMELDEVVMGVKEMKVADKTSESSIKIPCKVNSCQECSFISSDSKQLDKNMNTEHIVSEENKIPERLQSLLAMKGIDIKQYRLRRVGGGGNCGVKCVSLHTTGTEKMANKIRENVNEHIVRNWSVYKESYEFPYTERVGNGNRTFQDESEFLAFLREDEDASSLWMTHVCMQAVSTMLNIKINILTTGITPPIVNRCPRCKPPQNFKNDEDLRIHTEKVHHRAETEEEREGRRQKARWSELKPDYRIAHKSVAGNAEEMILLHEDDIHYNIIVHKSHNGVRRENGINEHESKHREDSESIFGERLYEPPKISKSWAQATKLHCYHGISQYQ